MEGCLLDLALPELNALTSPVSQQLPNQDTSGDPSRLTTFKVEFDHLLDGRYQSLFIRCRREGLSDWCPLHISGAK